MTSASDEFVVRPMEAADLARVLEIAVDLKDAPRWPRSAYLAAFDPGAASRRIALAAEDPGSRSVEGFMIARLADQEAELETIAVAAAHQRRGLGRMLLEALIGELRRAGIRKVFLEVRASNEAGLGLYQRAGFEEAGRRAGYYADPIEDAVVMRLSLD